MKLIMHAFQGRENSESSRWSLHCQRGLPCTTHRGSQDDPSRLSTQLPVRWAQSHCICWWNWGLLLFLCCSMGQTSKALPVPSGRCHHVNSPPTLWAWEPSGEGSAILHMGFMVTPLIRIWERWGPSPALHGSSYVSLGKCFSWGLAEASLMGWQ